MRNELNPALKAHCPTGKICAEETFASGTCLLPSFRQDRPRSRPVGRQTQECDHGPRSRTILTHACTQMAKRDPVKRSASVTGLYWSNCGDVLCLEHAKEIGALRWQEEEWEPLPAATQCRTKGWRYQCERCSPQGKAVVHAFEAKRLVVREPNKGRLRRALSVFSIVALVQRVITSILRRRKTA